MIRMNVDHDDDNNDMACNYSAEYINFDWLKYEHIYKMAIFLDHHHNRHPIAIPI